MVVCTTQYLRQKSYKSPSHENFRAVDHFTWNLIYIFPTDRKLLIDFFKKIIALLTRVPLSDARLSHNSSLYYELLYKCKINEEHPFFTEILDGGRRIDTKSGANECFKFPSLVNKHLDTFAPTLYIMRTYSWNNCLYTSWRPCDSQIKNLLEFLIIRSVMFLNTAIYFLFFFF